MKLFPSRSECFKLPVLIYGLTQFRFGVRTGFLGHSLFRTFIYPICLLYHYISTVLNPSLHLLSFVHMFIFLQSFLYLNGCFQIQITVQKSNKNLSPQKNPKKIYVVVFIDTNLRVVSVFAFDAQINRKSRSKVLAAKSRGAIWGFLIGASIGEIDFWVL